MNKFTCRYSGYPHHAEQYVYTEVQVENFASKFTATEFDLDECSAGYSETAEQTYNPTLR